MIKTLKGLNYLIGTVVVIGNFMFGDPLIAWGVIVVGPVEDFLLWLFMYERKQETGDKLIDQGTSLIFLVLMLVKLWIERR